MDQPTDFCVTSFDLKSFYSVLNSLNRVLHLFLQDCLTPLSMQALPDAPESLCIAEMGGTEGRDGEPGLQGQLYLNIGNSTNFFSRTLLSILIHDEVYLIYVNHLVLWINQLT